MRLLIAGGGTGGHLFPGVAVAEALRARDPSSEVLFVGTARGIEVRVCKELGLPLELIDASGLKTVGALGALRGLLRVPRALLQSRRIVKRFRPDVVIGVGGYASGPVLLAAWLRRIPTAIVEPNSIPGLANRMAGKLARAVFLSFEESRRYFSPKRVILTGNPIRAKLLAAASAAAPDSGRSPAVAGVGGPIPRESDNSFHIFCFGGSLGARAVNALMLAAAADLAASGDAPAIVHQTGKDERDAVAAGYQAAGIRADVRDFIADMAAEYARADLVVARAGATTVAELAIVGRPAILVPYPFAADDHQTKNARALADAGAALLFPQAELDGPKLAAAIRALMKDRGRLERMQSAMESLGRPDAAGAIVDWLEKHKRT